MKISVPLRGAFFRKDGKAVLSFLSAGQFLALEPEPDNQYDPHAIKVTVPKSFVAPHIRDLCNEVFPGFGIDPETFWDPSSEEETIHLGYVGKEFCAEVYPILGACTATLAFSPEGKPQVEIEA